MKAVAIVTSTMNTKTILNLSTIYIFVVSHFLIAKVSSEWRLNPGLGIHKKCPFLVNRGVPSIEVTNTNIHVNIFRRPYFVSPE